MASQGCPALATHLLLPHTACSQAQLFAVQADAADPTKPTRRPLIPEKQTVTQTWGPSWIPRGLRETEDLLCDTDLSCPVCS